MHDELEPPPANADEWSDQQWIDWLKKTDAPAVSTGPAAAVTKGHRTTPSSGGQILGDAMVGLARAIYGRQKEQPMIVVESGEPGDEQPFALHLDFEHPDHSYVILSKETNPTDRQDDRGQD